MRPVLNPDPDQYPKTDPRLWGLSGSFERLIKTAATAPDITASVYNVCSGPCSVVCVISCVNLTNLVKCMASSVVARNSNLVTVSKHCLLKMFHDENAMNFQIRIGL